MATSDRVTNVKLVADVSDYIADMERATAVTKQLTEAIKEAKAELMKAGQLDQSAADAIVAAAITSFGLKATPGVLKLLAS
jgi:hypothetical protein